MSRTYIPAELRQRVTARAKRCCEYCLIHEDDSYYALQVDHFNLDGVQIIPLTNMARVTERLLQLNIRERLLEREILQIIGCYPPEGATF